MTPTFCMIKQVHRSLFTCIHLLLDSSLPFLYFFILLRRGKLEGGDVCKRALGCEDVKPHSRYIPLLQKLANL